MYYRLPVFRADIPPSPYGSADESSHFDDDSGQTIFEAIQQQLGLKLNPGKGPVPVFVVDYASKMPTEN